MAAPTIANSQWMAGPYTLNFTPTSGNILLALYALRGTWTTGAPGEIRNTDSGGALYTSLQDYGGDAPHGGGGSSYWSQGITAAVRVADGTETAVWWSESIGSEVLVVVEIAGAVSSTLSAIDSAIAPGTGAVGPAVASCAPALVIGWLEQGADFPAATRVLGAGSGWTILYSETVETPERWAPHPIAVYQSVVSGSSSPVATSDQADPGWTAITVGFVGALRAGVWIDWANDGFSTDTASDGSLARMMPEAIGVSDEITSDVLEFAWNRGGTSDLAGGVSPGSCTILVKNATGKYNPDNTAGALYGKLRPGRPVWIGVNGNGSMVETAGQTVYGVFAGRIREIAPQPLEQVAEIICDDPLAIYRRRPVRLAGSTSRSQATYRAAIMAAIGEPSCRLSLPAESAMLPLSSLDTTDALAALDELNRATGTRHYVQPSSAAWYVYTARDRHYHLGGAPDLSLDFGSDRVVSIDGYRVTDETVINIQKTTVSPVSFPLGSGVVWMYAQVPLTVAGNLELWAEFADYVADASLEVTSSGATVTATLTSFGTTAKIDLYSTDAQIQRLVIVGKLAIREPSVSYVADDETSKTAYGSRSGNEISSDLFGGPAEAKGRADHVIWRYAQPLTSPAITLRGAPVATSLRELYDVVAVTSSALSVTARRFDIVGISGHWRTATATVSDFEVVWQLSESPLQTSRIFFTIGTSIIDGPDVIGY